MTSYGEYMKEVFSPKRLHIHPGHLLVALCMIWLWAGLIGIIIVTYFSWWYLLLFIPYILVGMFLYYSGMYFLLRKWKNERF